MICYTLRQTVLSTEGIGLDNIDSEATFSYEVDGIKKTR